MTNYGDSALNLQFGGSIECTVTAIPSDHRLALFGNQASLCEGGSVATPFQRLKPVGISAQLRFKFLNSFIGLEDDIGERV